MINPFDCPKDVVVYWCPFYLDNYGFLGTWYFEPCTEFFCDCYPPSLN